VSGLLIILTLVAAGLIGAVFGYILAVASEKFKVVQDPRIEEVLEALPGVNCGGCGYPGCSGYAAAIVNSGVDKTLCAPGGPDVCKVVARIMGEELGEVVPNVAVAACQGDAARAPDRAVYDGVPECRAAHLLQGGPKGCIYGCLGLGTCVDACTFDAIMPGPGGIPVVSRELCTGCGACVRACPRGVMKLIPVTAEYYLACNSHYKGKEVKNACAVGCTACKQCEKKGPAGAIIIEDNLPVLHYDVALAWSEANDVCKQGCFVQIKPTVSRVKNREEGICVG
jgi:Na+-translocating ferredoxin:NAD+ oxidoreductase RNF subunit RnfB